MLHGREQAERANETARQTFEEGVTSTDLPHIDIETSALASGLGVLSAFVEAGLVQSTGEARRQIKGGGLRVNDVIVTDDRMRLTATDLNDSGSIKLSLGKKRHILLTPKA